MKTEKTQWYQLEVTEEQLQIIQKSVEAVSRAKIGRWGDFIELVLEDYDIYYDKSSLEYEDEFVTKLEKIINRKIRQKVQGIKGKRDEESYQLYRDILHHFAKNYDPKGEDFKGAEIGIYREDRVVSTKPRIKIKEVKIK